MSDFNISIQNEHWDARTEHILFTDNTGQGDAPTRIAPMFFGMLDLLVTAGIFSSRTQARKAGWEPGWPPGWTDITVGKKRIRICVWNPVEAP